MSMQKMIIVLMLFLALLLSASGCMNYSFGETIYNNSKLNIQIYNSGEERYSTVQVTIFSLKDLRQKEYTKCVETVWLKNGLNEYSFPVELEEGEYKMYLYILEDKKRASAQIRDIKV